VLWRGPDGHAKQEVVVAGAEHDDVSDHWDRIYRALSHTQCRGHRSARPVRQRNSGRGSSEMARISSPRPPLSSRMSAREIATVFTQWTLNRIESAGLGSQKVTQIGPWLNPYCRDADSGA
jgi:hypothetical protein